MQALLAAWRFAAHVVTALFFNPPGLTGWAAWLTIVIRTVVFIVLFRRNLAPFLLYRISRHVRARSISLRSIRGLYVRRGGRIWRVDRIGWSLHPFSRSRVSVIVEGLRMEILAPNHTSRGQEKDILSTTRSQKIGRIVLWLLLAVKDAMYLLVWSCGGFYFLPHIQAFWSSVTIGTGQLFVRFVPSIIRDVDFEMDSITVKSQCLLGAGISVKGLKFDVAIDMSQDTNTSTSEHRPTRISTTRSKSKAHAERFWERVWGQTLVSVALNMSVDRIHGFLGSESHTNIVPGSDSILQESVREDDSFFCISKGVVASVSVEAIPRIQNIKPHSLRTALNIPEIEIFHDNLRYLWTLQAQSQPQQPTTPVPMSPWSIPSPSSPTISSPRSPFVSAFSDFAKRRYSAVNLRRLAPSVPPETKHKPFASLIGSADLKLNTLRVIVRLPKRDPQSTSGYEFGLSKLHIHGGLSQARDNKLHLDWLGSRELDSPAYRLTCQTQEIRLQQHRGSARSTTCLLRGLDANTLLYQLPWITPAKVLGGDANGPFIAGEFSLSRIQLGGTMDTLSSLRQVLPAPNKVEVQQPRPSRVFLPRLELKMACSDISLRFRPEECKPIIDLRTAGIALGLHTTFDQFSGRIDDGSPRMHADGSLMIEPISVRALTDETLRNLRSMEDIVSLIVTENIEVNVTASQEGAFDDTGLVNMERRLSTLGIKCITDAIAFELWNEDLIASTQELLSSWKYEPREEGGELQSAQNTGINLSVHFAIAAFTVVATGKDLNTSCDLGLSRGLEVCTGVTLHFQKGRISLQPEIFDAGSRKQLGIIESSNANDTFQGNDATYTSCLLWKAKCSSTVATPYEYGPQRGIGNDRDAVLFEIPRIMVEFTAASTLVKAEHSSRNVAAEIPFMRCHFNMLNLYSVLLATHTLRSIVPQSTSKGSTSKPRGHITGSLQLYSLHVDCQFPLKERLFLEVTSVFGRYVSDTPAQLELKSLAAYVPSQREHMWEELARVRGVHIIMNDGVDGVKPTLRAQAEGLKIAIPYTYVLSDLILDVVLSIKAIKHLKKTVDVGTLSPVSSPPPESAKILPFDVDISIGILTLEAADDPFEAKLGLIWRTGAHAQRLRIERELAFEAKLRAVTAIVEHEDQEEPIPQSDLPYHFTAKRTTSIGDARHRLNMVHSMSWISAFSRQREKVGQKEDSIFQHLHSDVAGIKNQSILPFKIRPRDRVPPLFRTIMKGLHSSLSKPVFGNEHMGFLKDIGDLPTSTEFWLLVPLHLDFTLDATMIMVRDYPLPMLNVLPNNEGPSLHFKSDLVIAEETGPMESVQWFQCTIVPENAGIAGSSALTISIPKTVMPVKTYACPHVAFTSKFPVEFTWGVSYHPAVQDVMRIIETLTSPPQDSSPSIGFWDKLRLVLHWRIRATFQAGARLHFKGSRDSHHITGEGAGFNFNWDGNVVLDVGQSNSERELIQLTSNTMEISIPDYDLSDEEEVDDVFKSIGMRSSRSGTKKTCARFTNGIRWGIGIILERTCDKSCNTCQGDAFNRQCRFFQFIPHHAVKLRCNNKNSGDSYAGFRSNFIHFSTSLKSPLYNKRTEYNSFHLSPKTFAHFWSWWHLFDSALSLPIRQGRLFPEARPPTKKFGKHLATIKYRLSFTSLYIAHVYTLDSGEAWAKGETHCVGVKAFLEKFQADMHQREEEWTVLRRGTDEYKKVKHKPFSAVDVVITGLDLRALFAVFLEPGKATFPLPDAFPGSRRFWEDLTPLPMTSEWIDPDDFVELDWIPTDGEPNLYMHQAVHCPRFTYFKRTPHSDVAVGDDGIIPHLRSKFGEEDTHVCLMGKEPTAHETQLEFAVKRLAELKAKLRGDIERTRSSNGLSVITDDILNDEAPLNENLKQMISVLERYIVHLSRLNASALSASEGKPLRDLYDMPADIAIPEELGAFANVYQVHCPKIQLDNATRDILHQYYVASRARRGFEYHMSARAVKFIRDQIAILSQEEPKNNTVKRRARAGSAHAAAQAVRRMITKEDKSKGDMVTVRQTKKRAHPVAETDPLYGWDEGVTEKKSHLCLLLKPQIVLRSDRSPRSILVLVADHVILRNYGILDTVNANDPVSGYIMQRNYASANSLQVFQPTPEASTDHLPFEVFVDVRCETRDFERIVQQTQASLRYDKFNRLRLRNELTTVALASGSTPDSVLVDHLLHETDLIQVEVPRFSFAADSQAFAAVGDIVSGLLLFSDPAYKARMTQLETMTFSYDFTDFGAAAKVIADLQTRIRRLVRLEDTFSLRGEYLDEGLQRNMLSTRAHIFKLSQELNLIFDAIRLAQDKQDGRNQDKKSALQVEFSASEISWLILDETRELLAKLAVRGIHFSWLSRKDSSTNSMLSLVDLQAFDGSPDALWPEILAKYTEPPTHRMIKRGQFVEAQWSALAPVGGISIYDHFKVELHPIRLALETRLGNKLADYFIPSRRARRQGLTSSKPSSDKEQTSPEDTSPTDTRVNQTSEPPKFTLQLPDESEGKLVETPTLRAHQIPQRPRLVASRSFTNLRSTLSEQRSSEYYAPGLPRSISSIALGETRRTSLDSSDEMVSDHDLSIDIPQSRPKQEGDASEMRQRSSQKTFVHAEIPSVHVLLSVMKGRNFLVKEARLRTHDLEWHNRTSSLEELVNQFIPSDPSLRGWVKVAWQQPIFSVGGVMKELITKTQWGRLGKDEPEDRHKPRKRRNSGPQARVQGSLHAMSTSNVNLAEPFPQAFPRSTGDNEDGPEGQERHPRKRVQSLFERPKHRSPSRTRLGGLLKRPGSRKSTESRESSAVPIPH